MRAMIFLSALVACGSLALAQLNLQPQPRSKLRELSLQECITIALEQNFDIQMAYYDPEMTRFSLAGTYGAYDPSLGLSGRHDYSRAEGLQGTTETEGNTFAGGLGGYLPWGLSYNLGASISDSTSDVRGFGPGTNIINYQTNTFLDTTVTPNDLVTTRTRVFDTVPLRTTVDATSGTAGALTLRQPLLKNFWVDATRLTIRNLKKAVQSSDKDYADMVMLKVTDVETAYFRLVFADENVKVRETALELAQRLVAENRKKVEVGAMAPLDEKQAEAQAAASKAELIASMGTRDTAERLLKDLLSNDYTNQWATVQIKPTDSLLAIPQQFDLQESWSKGIARGPRYRLVQNRLRIEQIEEEIRYGKNQLYPQVDAIGSYTVSGASLDSGGVFRQMREGDNPSWYFGAEMSIPLGQTGARNSLKERRATKEQATLLQRQLEQRTLIQIENDIAKAVTDFERVDSTRQARRFAEAALEAEQKKLDNGKSTSFVVLQLQRDLTEARSQEISALAEYNIDLANLAYDEGSTLERRNISMEIIK
jgi:outer membrane protein